MKAKTLLAIACVTALASCGGGQNAELLANGNAFVAKSPFCARIIWGSGQIDESIYRNKQRLKALIDAGLLRTQSADSYLATPLLRRIAQKSELPTYSICPASVVADSIAQVAPAQIPGLQNPLDVEVRTHLAWADWAKDSPKIQSALQATLFDQGDDLKSYAPALHLTMIKDAVTGWQCDTPTSTHYHSGPCR